MENEKNDQTSCCICLSDVDEVSQATMELCCHIFHIDCILTWGKKVNKCPLCKIEFHRILFQGKKVEVKIDDANGDESVDPSESDDDMEFDSDEDDEDVIYCDICEEECTMEGERFTYCRGNCGKYIHLSCRGLMSEDNWYCYDCQPTRRATTSRRTEIPERTRSVSSSLRWAEDSISTRLRSMQQKMVCTPYEPPLEVPKSSESAVRLRSKSKLATDIAKEIMNDYSKPSNISSDPETSYKRIRRNTTPPSSVLTSHPIPTSSEQTLLLTNKLAQNAQNSRKLESSSVNDILTRLTAPSRGLPTLQPPSPAFPSITSSSSYTTTTSRAPVMLSSSLKKDTSYSTVSPVNHATLSTQSSNPNTGTTRDLVQQYMSQLQAPLRISNLERRGEMLSNLGPKILSLCVLQSNEEFLSELLDHGILSIFAQYLMGAAHKTEMKLDSTSSSNLPSCRSDLQQSDLSLTMQNMILRTIHCLPIKARHLFHLRTLQPNPSDPKTKIGKFIPLIRILANYLEHEGKGDGDVLRNLSIRILNDWKTILKHYPSAVAKVETLLGK
jgi:hypothetical protein